jgi:hypothetical protein
MFIVHKKILCAIHLKHTSFWLSADGKDMQNDLLHAMPWQYMFALFMFVLNKLGSLRAIGGKVYLNTMVQLLSYPKFWHGNNLTQFY